MEAKLVVGIVVAVIEIAAIVGVAMYFDPLIAFMIAFMLFIIPYVLGKRYESAKKKAEKARKLTYEIKAKKNIKEAESVLNDAKLYGYISDTRLERLLDEARREFDAGKYEEAINHAEECKRLIREWKGKAKPEIEIDIPLKEYKLNYWKRTIIHIKE